VVSVALLAIGCGVGDDASEISVAELAEAERLDDLGAVVDRAARAFRRDGDEHVATTDTLLVRTAGARIAATPVDAGGDVAIDGTPITLETISITAGTRALDAAVRDVAIGPAGELIARRAELDEQLEVRPEGLEQRWAFAARPGDGDLVVRVAVSGHDFLAATDAGLHFAAGDGLGVAYSHGIWIDATGVETPIEATWDGAAIELRVPGDVVGRSAFPAVLDPTVTAEKAIDVPIGSSPTGTISRSAGAAFSGAQYLVVWEDTRAGTPDIYATRLSTTGAVLDTVGLPIAANAWPETSPSVAFVGGQYLVVWVADGSLAGARVSTAGVVTPLAAAGAPGVVLRPRLAARGSEALVAYESGGNIYASRFAAGAFSAPAAVAATTDPESTPAVSANPAGDYLVVWTAGTAARDVRGRFVSAAGAAVGTAFDVSAAASGQIEPSAAFAGGNHLVVWTNDSRKIYGTRVSPGGGALDTRVDGGVTVGGVPIATTLGVQRTPSLVCGTGCLLAWQDRQGAITAEDIYAMRVNPDLTAAAAAAPVSNGIRAEKKPTVVLAGAGYLAVWDDARSGENPTIYGARISGAGVVLDALGLMIARGYNEERSPAVVRGASQWLAAWSDSRVIGNNILATRVNNGGNIVDDPAISLSNAISQQGTPDLAASGVTGTTDVMAVWSDHRGASRDIYAARMSSTGVVVDLTGFAVSTADRDQLVPVIAANNAGRFLVVWQDQRKGSAGWDIWGAVISTAGAVVVPEFPISTATRAQQRPAIAYSPTNQVFLVVWADTRGGPGTSDIYGARVTAAGSVLDASGVAISTASRGQLEPRVEFGASRFLVVWRDQRTDQGNIYAARVRAPATGAVVDDPAGIAIGVATSKQYQPDVAYQQNGANAAFALVWTDERNLGATGSDIYGRLVTESTGALLGAEHVLSNGPTDESAPSLARGRATGNILRTMLVYQSLSTTLHAKRVMLRRVTYTEL
jgi:hypothetical protein